MAAALRHQSEIGVIDEHLRMETSVYLNVHQWHECNAGLSWMEIVYGSMFSGKCEDLIVVGAAGMYEARCRRCFEPNLAAVELEKKKQMELVAVAR